MFKNWNKQLIKIPAYFSKPWQLFALGGLFLVMNLFVLGPIQEQLMALSGGVGVIDLMAWYSPEEAQQRLNAYGPEGRKLYLMAEWLADFIYPVIYCFFFAGLVYRFGGGEWSLLTVYSAIVDWIENIFISIMLVVYPVFYTGVAQIAAIMTSLKWILAFTNIMMILVFLFNFVAKRWKPIKAT
jgi:hypothetical protein